METQQKCRAYMYM